MLTTLSDYRLVAGNLDASLRNVSEQPEVKREAEHYLARIGEIKTIEEFLADERIYRFAIKASGLEDMIYAKAFMRKVLEEGIESPDSFANKLADTRFRDFARRFNFHSYGASATTFERARQAVVDDYIRLTLEEQSGQSNEGVRLALYFQRKAPSLKTGYDVLADRALMKVAETILGYSLVHGDIDKHAKAVEKALDLANLQKPGALDKLIARFTVMWDMNNPGGATAGFGGAGGQAASALLVQPLAAGVGQDLLMTLQTLKITGR